MNKFVKKGIAVALCLTLTVGSITAYALSSNGKEDSSKKFQADTSSVSASGEAVKDETVYVLANADGTVKKIIVSDWLKNASYADSIKDRSDLKDIENVKGEESYTLDESGATCWDAQGKDIYYQGLSEGDLPVGMTISYTLDGKPISAEELAGKSGKVTIRFDYDNRQYQMVKINGKQEKIYVPFAMLTGMILDNDTFRNIEVSGGKLINDGDRTVVIGLALPGLQENLNIDKEKLEIPSYVKITADAQSFQMGMTVTVATNELFSEMDMDKLSSVDDLKDSVTKLSSGMEALMDGSSTLYEGLSTLLSKSQELVNGINALADGAAALKSGAYALYDGAGRISTGANSLNDGLQQLSDNSASLNGGAKQVFDSLLSMAAQQIAASGLTVPSMTVSNYADVLNGLIDSLDETAVYNAALAQVTGAVEANRPLIRQKVTETVQSGVTEKVTAAVRDGVAEKVSEAVKPQVQAQVTETVKVQVKQTVTNAVKQEVTASVIQNAAGMTPDEYAAAVEAGLVSEETQQAVTAAVDAQMTSDEVAAKIDTLAAAQMETEEIATAIAENTQAQMQTLEVQNIIAKQTDAQMQTEDVKARIASTIEEQMKSQEVLALIDQNEQLQVEKAISENMASDEVQSKLQQASQGAASIISLKASLDSYNAFYLGLLTYTGGVDRCAAGTAELISGTNSLQNGALTLRNGASALYDGILQLKDGAPALINGITALKDGSMELSEGLEKFNKEGIAKIVDLVDGDLEVMIQRLKATVDVSKAYQSYSGIGNDMEGNVKFLYRTDEIG